MNVKCEYVKKEWGIGKEKQMEGEPKAKERKRYTLRLTWSIYFGYPYSQKREEKHC